MPTPPPSSPDPSTPPHSTPAAPPAALPIEPVLPALLAALDGAGRAVLQAPPGAGKTTRVPLALLAAGASGRIVMLEPRRVAARAAAERMAASLGEPVGETVGYTIRGDRRVSGRTRIEVVTEGVLTRRLQNDPGLDGTGTVIFDEFHERALQADLGLALTCEIRGALREDLRILVMSATLSAGPVAALLGNAPVLTTEGRAFPVETRWRDAPLPPRTRIEATVAQTVLRALAETRGGVLAFLPGAAEIRRTLAALAGTLPPDCEALPLYGALPPADQRRALAEPAPGRRRVVLATAIAETSLTLPGIRAVVDGGLARRSRFDPGSGMARLVTERVSRAEADQRQGRAGRVAPGVCYRLWSRGEHGALPADPPPEIATADLTGLALDLAQWGASEGQLAFLTPPPAPALAEARGLLRALGALDAGNAITAHGRRLAGLPLHPRLAHMLAVAGPQAAPLAALLDDGAPLPGAEGDLEAALRALSGPQSHGPGPLDAARRRRLGAEARRLARLAAAGSGDAARLGAGEMAALAYPDRIGLRRPGAAPRYLLSGGKGAALAPDHPHAGQRLIVAVDTDGDPREARIRLAAPVAESALRALFPDRLAWVEACHWCDRHCRVEARRQERLGALVLDDRPWSAAPPEAIAAAALDGVRRLGLGALGGQAGLARLRARIAAVRAGPGGDPALDGLPDPSDAALLDTAEAWLLPWLAGIRDAAGIATVDAAAALAASMPPPLRAALDRAAPAQWQTPQGRRVAIDYAASAPEVRVRLQEVFGLTRHPEVAGRALRVTLLSPAGRPVQTTTDLPGFWAGSYADVRKDMRARYPKHAWPEDPAAALPPARGQRRR